MRVGEHLNSLEFSGLIVLAQSQPDLEYVFRHVLVQEAAYDSLLRAHRRQLHRAVGEALEALFPQQRTGLAGVLAYHFENAEDSEKALGYLLLAGQDALSRFAYREARDYFERAEAHLGADDSPEAARRRVAVRLSRVESGFTFIPFDENLALAEAVLPAAQSAGDPGALARVHLLIARIRDGRGESYEASAALRRSLDEALEIGRALNDDSLRARPLAVVGRSIAFAEPRRGAAMLQEAVPLLERLGDLKEASLSSGFLAAAHALLGEFALAEPAGQRALAWAEATGDPNVMLDAELMMGIVCAERGRMEDGMAFVRRSIARANEVGNTLCATVGNFHLGNFHLRLGQPRQALAALQTSGELAEFCDASFLARVSRAWVSTARAQLGEVDEVQAGWQAGLRIAAMAGDKMSAAQIRHGRANALAARPDADWSQIAADYEASIATYESFGARPSLARALRDYGVAMLSRPGADSALAQAHLRRAADLFEALDMAAEAAAARAAIGATAPVQVR